MKANLKDVKASAEWLGAVSGSGVPAFTFFSSFTPPLFPSVSIITAALSGAIIFGAAAWKPGRVRNRMSHLVTLGGIFLIIAVVLLIGYMLMLQFTTVQVPNASAHRLQIGFGRADWTLTPAGRNWTQQVPDITVEQMIRNEAAFTQDRIQILWQTWSIYSAGALLIVFYFFAFCFWTGGFALLAKQRSLQRTGKH